MATPRRHDEGAEIFGEGRDADQFFLLLDGYVRVVRTLPTGDQVILRHIPPGELIGMARAFNRATYPATALTASEALTLSWPSRLWGSSANWYGGFAEETWATVAARLEQAHDHVVELASKAVEQRVAACVLRMVNQSGRQVDGGMRSPFADLWEHRRHDRHVPLHREPAPVGLGEQRHPAKRPRGASSWRTLTGSGRFRAPRGREGRQRHCRVGRARDASSGENGLVITHDKAERRQGASEPEVALVLALAALKAAGDLAVPHEAGDLHEIEVQHFGAFGAALVLSRKGRPGHRCLKATTRSSTRNAASFEPVGLAGVAHRVEGRDGAAEAEHPLGHENLRRLRPQLEEALQAQIGIVERLTTQGGFFPT